MEQIASDAGVSKRTLYKYFPAKEALLENLLEADLATSLATDEIAFSATAGFRRNVTGRLEASATWCERHADWLLPYIRYKFSSFDPTAAGADDTGLVPVWIRLITVAQERGELTHALSSCQLGVYFHYLYLGALMRWLTEPRLDLRAEFEAVVALFTQGAELVAR